MIADLLSIEAPANPTRAEWLDWRRTGIGASESSIILGVAPEGWGSPLAIYFDKLGQSPEREATIPMRIGTFLESFIAELYTEATGIELVGSQVLARSVANPFMIASLDRVTSGGRIVELKYTSGMHHKFTEDPDDLPAHFVVQGNHQMEVYGTDRVTFCILIAASGDLIIIDLYRNQELIDSMIQILGDFWQHVIRQEPPDVVTAVDAKILGKIFRCDEGYVELSQRDAEAADAWTRIGPEIKALESERETAKARLLLSLGNENEGGFPDGRRIKKAVSNIKERTQTVKAHTQTRITIRESRFH